MACFKIGLRILDTSKVKRVTRPLAAFPAPSAKRLIDAERDDREAAACELGARLAVGPINVRPESVARARFAQ
jgi:hypothetical protein